MCSTVCTCCCRPTPPVWSRLRKGFALSELAARSPEECVLYLSLLPCPRCGGTGLEPTVFEPHQGFWAYETECVHCGHAAALRFEAADPAGPSRLLDAGQYLAHAEQLGELVPAETGTGLMEPEEVVGELQEAIDAIGEALWAAESLTRYDADPEVFRRRQLLAVLGTFQRLRAEHAAAA